MSDESTLNVAKYLDVSPEVCFGKPRVVGTRISVHDIAVWHERMSLSADEIASRHPELSLSAIYAALAYYFDNRSRIDAEIRTSRLAADALREGTPSKLPPTSRTA